MFCNSIIISLVVCGLFALCSANAVTTDKTECPQICPDDYTPLCGTNGQIYKKFSNVCDLKASNCLLERSALQKYVATAMDLCNTEMVANLDLLLEKLGNLDLENSKCLKACTMIYMPVCISNGQYRAEVSNECIMEAFNCALAEKGANIFRVLQKGSC